MALTMSKNSFRFSCGDLDFKFPGDLRGLRGSFTSVGEALRDLKNLNPQTQRGTVTSLLADLEAILKDLVGFYSMALWEKEIDEIMETEEIEDVEGLEKFLEKMFAGITQRKPLHKLTFGQLKNLVFAIDEKAATDKEQISKIRKMIGRETILADKERNLLDLTSRLRTKFTHDYGQPPDTDDCLECLRAIEDLLSRLKEGAYPTSIMITREVTNEYGVSFCEGIDEFDRRWTMNCNPLGDESGFYLMKGGDPPVAIDPIIVEKFWSRPRV